MRGLEGRDVSLVKAATASREAVTRIAEAAGLVGDEDQVRYVPSRAARDRVAGDEDGAWPQALVSRHRKMVRRSIGAVFRFPVETTGQDDEVAPPSLTAFVTDWTGLPSSCAIAVHPGHALSTGLAPEESASFTGRFCRHPLTGDLLPIWVADWVKPEFGTGAVLINPGHNAADLEFSRKAGLPVRFSLAPKDYDGAREDWPKPPFIKSGYAFRTGATDGLSFDEAKTAYFATIAERGLVEEYTDSGMGTFEVASVADDGDIDLMWDRRRRTVGRSDTCADSISLLLSPVLHSAEEHVRAGELTVVTPSTRVEDDLLALRLLLAEPGLEPAVKNAPEVVVVGNAQLAKGVGAEVEDAVLGLALLVSASPLDTLSVKPQHIEPCERFLKVHETLSAREPAASQDVSPEIAKAAGQVKGLLGRQDLKQAFTQLYRLQKTLAKSESVGEQDMLCYAALAHVLAGVRTSYDQEVLATAWKDI
ncbi:hypothetical protein AB0G85_37395 [Streptomyces sioyaensis]|uniref:hypothetical protein n=1 Tax=Streptomyces sioyaensis TaxID=67364 RepID=UPI0033FB3F32